MGALSATLAKLGSLLSIDGSNNILLPATPAQFDNSLLAATTGFVQQALGNMSGIQPLNATGNIPASYAGQMLGISATSNITLTLPALSSVANGTIFCFVGTSNSTAKATISPASGDGIVYSGSGGNVTPVVAYGDSVYIVKFGSGWQAFGGSLQLGKSSTAFGSSIASNGYQKLPSGLIIQWGSLTIPINSTSAVTFPIAFPSNCYGITQGFALSGGNFYMTGTNSITLTGFNFMNVNTGSATTVYWMAIGK